MLFIDIELFASNPLTILCSTAVSNIRFVNDWKLLLACALLREKQALYPQGSENAALSRDRTETEIPPCFSSTSCLPLPSSLKLLQHIPAKLQTHTDRTAGVGLRPWWLLGSCISPHNSPSPQHPPTALPEAFPEKKWFQQGQPPAFELPSRTCWPCSQRQRKPGRSQGCPIFERLSQGAAVHGAGNGSVPAETKLHSGAGTEPRLSWEQGNRETLTGTQGCKCSGSARALWSHILSQWSSTGQRQEYLWKKIRVIHSFHTNYHRL